MIKPKIFKVLHNPLKHPVVMYTPNHHDGVPLCTIRLPTNEFHNNFYWKEIALSDDTRIVTSLHKMFESHFISKFYD